MSDQPADKGAKVTEIPIKKQLKTITIAVQIPEDFEPIPNGVLAVLLGKDGKSFTNAPPGQPHLALHLATLGLNYASQHAVQHLQNFIAKQSPIIKPPPGMRVPTFEGPVGSG